MAVERVEVAGQVQAVTRKGVLLTCPEFEEWFPLRFCRVVSGCLDRGCRVVLSVPRWVLDKKESSPGSPSPSPVGGAAIPPDMLKRLINLCHPDKHNNSKASTLATEWLLTLRG